MKEKNELVFKSNLLEALEWPIVIAQEDGQIQWEARLTEEESSS